DAALERAARAAAHRRADPQLAVIDHRAGGRGTAHVPGPLHRLAVHVPAARAPLAEDVAARDVVPAPLEREADGAGPAVPVLLGTVRLAAEQEARVRQPPLTGQAQGVILVVGGEAGALGAALPDDVDVLPVADAGGVDPGFQRDGVAAG